MKAISIKMPWAAIIANGHKTVECRTWRTHYRGNLLICAGKSTEFIRRGRTDIALCGKALAVVKVIDCRKYTVADKKKAYVHGEFEGFAWVLELQYTVIPFEVKGQQGFFNVSDDLILRLN